MKSTSLGPRAARAVFLAFVLVAGACLLIACADTSPPTPTAIGGLNPVPTPPTGAAPPPEQTPSAAPTAAGGAATFAGDTIKIGVDQTLTFEGTPEPGMEAVTESVSLAIEQANAAGGVTIAGKTYKLAMTLLDDQYDPQISAHNAEQLVADPAVLAVVGPHVSVVAPGNMPIFNRAGLAQVSPANTNPALTRPEYGQVADLRPTGKLTYFRMLTGDDVEGPAAADFLYNTLRARKIYILDDGSEFGRPMADRVERRFRADGGTVLGREALPPDTQSFDLALKKAAGAKPDALYFGGASTEGLGRARKQMVAMGFNVPFVVHNSAQGPAFIPTAGAAAEGSYVTIVSPNPLVLPSARQFLTDFKARFGFEITAREPLIYAAPAYDATNVVIAALRRAAAPDREAVRQQIAATKDYPGALGPTSFDENGDTTNRIVAVFTPRDGALTFLDHVVYQGAVP